MTPRIRKLHSNQQMRESLNAWLVVQTGVKCVRLQGSMTMDHRDRMIEQFTHDPDVRVFLMSLKAGGVALNLTAASHVMLMDPW